MSTAAAKDLDEDSYASWAGRYKAACASSTNRAAKVAAVCEELETGLMLLGATAVEDKLQVGGGGWQGRGGVGGATRFGRGLQKQA
jgi:magnesium-transporting ATPase (P-type)